MAKQTRGPAPPKTRPPGAMPGSPPASPRDNFSQTPTTQLRNK